MVTCPLMLFNTLNDTVNMREWFEKYHEKNSSFNYFMTSGKLGYLISEVSEIYGNDKPVDF